MKPMKYVFSLFFMLCFVVLTTLPQTVYAEAPLIYTLFGNKKTEAPVEYWPPPPAPATPSRPISRQAPTKPARAEPATQTKQETPRAKTAPAIKGNASKSPATLLSKQEKKENAYRILVVGDFMASALASGLSQIYANNASVSVINKADASSGLVRDDYYDWQKQISSLINSEKPDVILVMIGANDNQSFRNKTADKIGTDAWGKEYQARVDFFSEKLKSSGKPWLWVGAPAFKKPSLRQAIVTLNALYKQAAENNGGRFVDIWAGFVDSEDNFTLSGYDANGNMAQLRTDDGVSFTNAGKRKLAFYVGKPLKQLLDSYDSLSSDFYLQDPNKRNYKKGTPMKLWEMVKQNQGLIAGKITDKEDPRYISPPVLGRADYFGLGMQKSRKNRDRISLKKE